MCSSYDDEQRKRDEEYEEYLELVEADEEYEREQLHNWYWYEYGNPYEVWGGSPDFFDEEDD